MFLGFFLVHTVVLIDTDKKRNEASVGRIATSQFFLRIAIRYADKKQIKLLHYMKISSQAYRQLV